MENEKDYNFRNISERINKEWDKCKLINIKLKNLNAKSIFCNIINSHSMYQNIINPIFNQKNGFLLN